MQMTTAIELLHDRCAVYTSALTASRLLDIVDWRAGVDLSDSILLEPCVGEGSILLESVRRLIASFRLHGRDLNLPLLSPRLKGFEFHPGAARSAKGHVRRLLRDEGLECDTADALASAWVCERDFLLEDAQVATHVVANPPYVRWHKLPSDLAAIYRAHLPEFVTRGDISVAFLHRMQEWAKRDGTIAALVSDRWMYAKYGESFVAQTRAKGWSIDVADERPLQPFVRDVGAYASIVVLGTKKRGNLEAGSDGRSAARVLHQTLAAKHGCLLDAGCQVRVGPALGAGRTFVIGADEQVGVEPELIRPFVEKQDLKANQVGAPRLSVVVPYDRDGKLIDPVEWPGFFKWIAAHEEVLSRRSHVGATKSFWRTIDAVPVQWAKSPKLLLPELCNVFRTTIDYTGSIPAHSLYAIWSDEWPVEVLARVLGSGLLELTAKAEAPKLKAGWVRFYKRFLTRTPLPKWSSLLDNDRAGLIATGEDFIDAFERLFDFRPGELPIA